MGRYSKKDIIRLVQEEDVQFIRVQFTDIFGQMENAAITASQVEKAVANEVMMDGSSIEGFVRIEESDHYLWPDLDTFTILPWRPQYGKAAREICDVHEAGGGHGLFLQRRPGAEIFPLPDRRRGPPHHENQRRGGIFRPGPPGPRGIHPPGDLPEPGGHGF